MSKMLEFVGYNGKPIFVARDKIMAVSDANEEKHGAPAATITMALGDTSEDWIVYETIEAVRAKYDNP